MASGETISGIAMTEPGAGSDLQSIRTTAKREGDEYVLNGSKTYITNGWNADVVVVVAKTNPELGAKGTSLFLVDADLPGFSKGKRLKKLGLKAQDTSELFFDNVKVPKSQRLGNEGEGFIALMQQLPWERMQIAIQGAANAQAAIDWTLQYVKDRKVFGTTVASYQNTRFKLAELKTLTTVTRSFIDACLARHLEGELDAVDAAMAKLHATETLWRVLDDCVQMHGGYGYMWEYPITRAWADNRVSRIAGGSSEIMKEIIGRTLVAGD